MNLSLVIYMMYIPLVGTRILILGIFPAARFAPALLEFELQLVLVL